jgi:hypothetical protein
MSEKFVILSLTLHFSDIQSLSIQWSLVKKVGAQSADNS